MAACVRWMSDMCQMGVRSVSDRPGRRCSCNCSGSWLHVSDGRPMGVGWVSDECQMGLEGGAHVAVQTRGCRGSNRIERAHCVNLRSIRDRLYPHMVMCSCIIPIYGHMTLS